MNRLSCPKICCYFIAALLGALKHGNAQVTLAIGHEQQQTTDVAVASPLAPGQIAVVSIGGGFAMQESTETVKNQPYQAVAVTEMKQTLADGSHITQTTTATVARDSEGRTVRIQKLSTIGPWKSLSDSSPGDGPTLTSIFDPVTTTHIDYTSDKKVAQMVTMPPPPRGAVSAMASGFAVAGSSAGPAMGMFSVERTSSSAADKVDENTKTESLGTKTIEGTQVTGTRSTTTIPAGTIGNDKDLIVTRETWYSPELKLVVQSSQNDPRFGQTTYSLTNIQRAEPDESLFQVPAGYKIEKPREFVNTHQ